MTDLDDLIKFENESTTLDFKAVQYLKSNYAALIKDIMSMANAHVSGDRYIIIGVKHRPDGTREYLSIDEGDFVDEASYQQLIRENVHPEIHFDYKPHRYDGHLFGVFRIYDCVDRPYVMRKDYIGLTRGDGFIRKGSHQVKLDRPDLDRIYAARAESSFSDKVRIGFQSEGVAQEITLTSAGKILLPSDREAEKIRDLINKREKPSVGTAVERWRELAEAQASILSGRKFYSQLSTEELKEQLAKLKNIYRDDDLYELYEEYGTKINLVVINDGEAYIEDASIHIETEKINGLRIAFRVYPKPKHPTGPFDIISPELFRRPYSVLGPRYPDVEQTSSEFEVRESIGNIKHALPTLVFQEPLRIVLGDELIGKTIKLRCTLYGKQLRKPMMETLAINVIEPTS